MVSQAAIEALRRAASTLDWNACRSALDSALAQVDTGAMLALAEGGIRHALPAFERHHPGEPWPHQALAGQTTELGPAYTGPGGGNFATAVEALMDARARASDPAACRAAVIDAVAGAVMAEMVAVWGADNPEGWRISYEAEEFLGSKDPMWRWSEDPKVRAAERGLWNDVADRLAALASPAPR